MKEIWKDIEGYEGMYQVSNFGRVKSLERDTPRTRPQHIKERILKQRNVNRHGTYLQVYLANAGKYKACLVHRLVAQAFIPNPNNKPVINHIDGNKHNNCAQNLEWSTHKENLIQAFVNGLNIPINQRKGRWTLEVEYVAGQIHLIEARPSNSK